ncbi:MAG: Rieske (2Fe-2S) protein [Actinobacteria bacterium]|nr:Rieske (2Fe-2S) protein [Actinomycetota bacterium]
MGASRRYRVGRAEEIRERDGILVSFDGTQVGVFRVGGRLVAYENRCRHQGGPVCTGEVLGRYEQILAPDKTVIREQFSEDHLHLVCPWHGWEYDLETGRCSVDPRIALTSFPVEECDGDVFVIA